MQAINKTDWENLTNKSLQEGLNKFQSVLLDSSDPKLYEDFKKEMWTLCESPEDCKTVQMMNFVKAFEEIKKYSSTLDNKLLVSARALITV